MVATSRAQKPKLLVIVGPTASGKSKLAMKTAKQFNGEIISADSWTVYKSFDIGTAKPTKADRQKVTHHLIDIVEAPAGFNAALFQVLATKAMKDIQSRGKLPILVGGSGLYIDSILFGYSFLPTVAPALRAHRTQKDLSELINEAQEKGIDLSRLDIRNKRRVIRALEANGQQPTSRDLSSNTTVIGVDIPNPELLKRVTKRVDNMLEAGLEKEVRLLAKKYGWQKEPLKGIGYREWQDYFNGNQSLLQTKQRIIRSSMQLVKKQRTWFKRNKNIKWFTSGQKAYNFLKIQLNT